MNELILYIIGALSTSLLSYGLGYLIGHSAGGKELVNFINKLPSKEQSP